ncbi:MAG: DNA polymerase III subunit gamma/tau [Endomicrobiia bacterium]
MSYIVLARKYRPQTFSDLVGQPHIVTTLKNALKSGKIWHAYIFSGTRGTGKTSTARIFAKAVNCLSLSSDFEPCNKCKNCLEITQGNCIDVIEIDAASNRGIDEIRSLRENVKYVPVSCKYKVYIIDEAHQITEAAFNAFLKTLEEPPNYVIFILATTEFNSLPQTIISRCQVFQFRPVLQNIIFERLKFVVKSENKTDKITDDALQLITESALGSVRDALSLLDQIFALTEVYPKVDSKVILKLWGSTPTEYVEKYVKLITKNDTKSILEVVEEIYNSGIDLIQFTKDVLEFFRKLLYFKTGNKLQDNIYDLEQFKDLFSTTHIISYIQQLLYLVEEIKRTEFPKIFLEIHSIKLTRQYVEINEIIKHIENFNTDYISEKQKDEDVSKGKKLTENEKVLEKKYLSNNEEENKGQSISVEKKEINFDKETLEFLWDKILEKIKIEKPLSYPILLESKICFLNDTLKILLPNKYVKHMLEQHNLNLEKILNQLTGKNFQVLYDIQPTQKIVLGEEISFAEQPNDVKPIEIKPKKTKITPEIEKFCKAFSGKIVSPKEEK